MMTSVFKTLITVQPTSYFVNAGFKLPHAMIIAYSHIPTVTSQALSFLESVI